MFHNLSLRCPGGTWPHAMPLAMAMSFLLAWDVLAIVFHNRIEQPPFLNQLESYKGGGDQTIASCVCLLTLFRPLLTTFFGLILEARHQNS